MILDNQGVEARHPCLPSSLSMEIKGGYFLVTLTVLLGSISPNFVRQAKVVGTQRLAKNFHSISPTFCLEVCPYGVR